MRQIRHIVPGIYHREIKKATNYVRRTNGNNNRNSIRTTYSSGGISTSFPKIEVNPTIEDSKDDFIFTIDSSYLMNGEFKIFVSSYLATTGSIVGLNKPYYIDWGDGKIEKFVVINTQVSNKEEEFRLMQKTHVYKEKKKYQIKVHHKHIPLLIYYIISSEIENRTDIPNSIISIEQWGLCSNVIPTFLIQYSPVNTDVHGMENLQSIPPLPYPYIETDGMPIRFGSSFVPPFCRSGLKTLPNGFFKNVALSVKEHSELAHYDLGWAFTESKIETFPEDLFKPFADFITDERIFFNNLFSECPIKDKFPPKYEPLNWRDYTTEIKTHSWGIFYGCKNIPNYDEIHYVLMTDSTFPPN